jgi:hypothetical protein
MPKDKQKIKVVNWTTGKGSSPAFPGTMSDFEKTMTKIVKSGPIKKGKKQ